MHITHVNAYQPRLANKSVTLSTDSICGNTRNKTAIGVIYNKIAVIFIITLILKRLFKIINRFIVDDIGID